MTTTAETARPAPHREPDWLDTIKGLGLLLWVVLGLAAMVALPLGGLYGLVRFVKWAWAN
jgi:hypothetical protein